MLTIDFAPLFPWAAIAGLAALSALLLTYGTLRRARGMGWRILAIAGLVLALANPVAVEEDREARADVLAVLVDDSASQKIAGRADATTKALAHIDATAGRLRNLEVRIIRAGVPDDNTGSGDGPVDGTRLFKALGRGIADIPQSRMAGTIVITDGQVHDIPDAKAPRPFGGPLHLMLTGKRNEFDRRIIVTQSPKYGIVGKDVTITIRIEDSTNTEGTVRLTLVKDGGSPRAVRVPIGRDHPVKLPLDHAGANILQMEVATMPGELTAINNRTIVAVNGVRERLRVLLVSGEPHPGERTWRNLLKADPSVDLVHFTILRPPEKQDMTPVRELSLIAFPIRELFEVKLNDFDLIIFDRYRRRGVLPTIYLDNIARYVENGGAILEASGPEFSSADTLFQTPLGRVLPGQPTGVVMTGALRPRLTDKGARHPVTADLPGAGIGEELPRWGQWYRQVEVQRRNGITLMNGRGDRPLLLVDRIQKGRVAQLASDHIWLWARGHGGGGPHAELLRRVAHWLMKEPELEENSLQARMSGGKLTITRRSVEPDDTPVELTSPSGKKQVIKLTEGIGGRASALVPVGETGIYRIRDRKHQTLAAVGNINPLEFTDMRTTGSRFAALSAATGGGIHWMEDGAPKLRRVRADRLTAGAGWLGVVDNRNFTVRNVREVPLLPGLLVLLLGLGALLLAWRAEGR
jgi:hypothetical protein